MPEAVLEPPTEFPLSAREIFPRAASVASNLTVVDGDAAESLAVAIKVWRLPHFASAASFDLHGVAGEAGPVAATLSAAVFVRTETAVHPMTLGMLALSSSRAAAKVALAAELQPVWPAELRIAERRFASVEVESLEGGAIVAIECDLYPHDADPFLAEYLYRFAELMARLELADGDVTRPALASEIGALVRESLSAFTPANPPTRSLDLVAA